MCVFVQTCTWLPAEKEAHKGKLRKDDNDGMCWHVPSGGFGVAVIQFPLHHTPHYSNKML